MNAEFFKAIADIEREKGIPREYMYGKIRQALIAAYKKDTPDCGDNIDVILDEDAGTIELVVIKTVVERAHDPYVEISLPAAQKINKAQTDAENTLKEARQSAARQFRDKIRRAEEAAEVKAKSILSKREADAKAFYAKHKDKVGAAASWITEEVMSRYGRG